jgi:hypothetical protein
MPMHKITLVLALLICVYCNKFPTQPDYWNDNLTGTTWVYTYYDSNLDESPRVYLWFVLDGTDYTMRYKYSSSTMTMYFKHILERKPQDTLPDEINYTRYDADTTWNPIGSYSTQGKLTIYSISEDNIEISETSTSITNNRTTFNRM